MENAERNLLKACKNCYVHGILLALRYTFEKLDWNSNVLLHSFAEIKHALGRLLELVTQITSLALWVVSADAWHIREDMEEMVDDEAVLLEDLDEIDSSEAEDKTVEDVVMPSEQIVMVGCWLAMKELSLLLGTVIRKVPLPTCNEADTSTDMNGKSVMVSDGVLDLTQLETIGNHFLEVLMK